MPVEDARENLLSVHKIAQQQGAKLLLIPEAITPDSSSLLDYSAMLKDLADAHSDIAYFDAPSLLLHDGGDHFLDDVRLSETGHRLLAKALVDKVQGLGWLNDSEGLDESSD